MPAASSGGLLAQLTQPSDPAARRPPAWPLSAPPFDASLGSDWAPAAPIAHLASSHIWPPAAPSRSPGAVPFPDGDYDLPPVLSGSAGQIEPNRVRLAGVAIPRPGPLPPIPPLPSPGMPEWW